ncbi:hypothetical protein [Rhizobium mulingense]|uniref:hypothetical protein n=1 Tax=Rhizobium mulingense TaxID=3031128 RepID=UPI002B49FB5E|nr:hypothetical protein [Rhizobium sp. MJ21]MEB3047050.1 hypothetical protein [Rhizobium sp. MJ21]
MKNEKAIIIPNQGEMLQLGQAWLSTWPGVLQRAVKLPTTWDDFEYTFVHSSLILASSREVMSDHSEAKAGASGTFSGVQLGLEGEYSRTQRITDYRLSIVISIVALTGSRSFPSPIEVEDYALDVYPDRNQFGRSYGDYFCSQHVFGGAVVGIGTYSSYSRNQIEEFRAAISASAVSFGGWGEVRRTIAESAEAKNFDFSFTSSGVHFNYTDGKVLKTADAFLAYCDKWIALALANKVGQKQPSRHYFTPYTSLPQLGNALSGDWIGRRELVERMAVAQDDLQAVGDWRGNRDGFEDVDPSSEQSINDAEVAARSFILEGQNRLEALERAPFTPVAGLVYTRPRLPGPNRYSKVAIQEHFLKGRYGLLQFERGIEFKIGRISYRFETGKAYIIFFVRFSSRDLKWYCIANEENVSPPDVSTAGPCVEPVFFAWGQKFRYDNRGFFSHYRADCFGRLVLSPNVPTSTETMLANLQSARRGVKSEAVARLPK